MSYLFDSSGRHIANFVSGHLFSPYGQNIGHYLADREIFINMQGKYLGQIIHNDRLMYKYPNSYSCINFGNRGNFGNIGNRGNPGLRGNIGFISSFRNIDTPWLHE